MIGGEDFLQPGAGQIERFGHARVDIQSGAGHFDHGLDVARWGLGALAPQAVVSGGGKYVFDDDQEVPDTQVVTYEFPNACLVWEHRMWSKHGTEKLGFGIAFYGDKGTLLVDAKGYRIEDPDSPGKPSESEPSISMASQDSAWRRHPGHAP